MNDTEDVKIIDKQEGWIKSYWRPAMAWQYFAVCLFDFLLAPIITGWYAWFAKIPYVVWKPITMSEGGFYHMAMGAIIGIVAWTRGKEKIARLEYNEVSEDFENETERRIKKAKQGE